MATYTGRVLWFSETKGFGFIEREDGMSVFFPHAALRSGGLATVNDGVRVEFEVPDDALGQQAACVKPL